MRDEEGMAKLFLSHVPEKQRTHNLIGIFLERMKSPKFLPFDYTDDYTREWFKHAYGLNRQLKLNKLNISADQLTNYLRKVSLKF